MAPDVADELPDSFVHALHAAVRETSPEGVVIGEVWEDGTTKVAYDVRRRHLLGGHLDGLMNYPFRTAMIDYLRGGDAAEFKRVMEQQRENYPEFAFYSAMNSLGTHDTLRILTLLGAGGEFRDQSKEWRANFRLSPEQRKLGKERLMAAAALLFCFPGSPTVYYGDEAGMEGFEDPLNRQTYPWGGEDRELMDWFRALGSLRKTRPALRSGDISYLAGDGPLLAFTRVAGGEKLLCAVNAGDKPARLELDTAQTLRPLLGQAETGETPFGCCLTLPPRSGCIFCVE